LHWVKVQLTETWSTFPSGLEPERYLEDLDMFRCRVCGSIGQPPQACGICDGAVREISQDPSGKSTVSRQLLRPFWTGTKMGASIIVVLFAISTVGAGLYFSARPSGPYCSNGAVNYPSCNSCGSSEAYSSSTKVCFSTDYAVNPPSCNRFCGNNAINPPNCDPCPDNHTDVVCPTGSLPETDKTENGYRFAYPLS